MCPPQLPVDLHGWKIPSFSLFLPSSALSPPCLLRFSLSLLPASISSSLSFTLFLSSLPLTPSLPQAVPLSFPLSPPTLSPLLYLSFPWFPLLFLSLQSPEVCPGGIQLKVVCMGFVCFFFPTREQLSALFSPLGWLNYSRCVKQCN